MSAFRDRIFELESEIAILSEKDKDINLVNEKLEVLRLSNARKDAIIRSQKDTLEKAQVELLSFKEISSSREADFEKHKGYVVHSVLSIIESNQCVQVTATSSERIREKM